MSAHAQWFAELGEPGIPILEIHTVNESQSWGVWLRVEGPFPTRKGAEIAFERQHREITELIETVQYHRS